MAVHIAQTRAEEFVFVACIGIAFPFNTPAVRDRLGLGLGQRGCKRAPLFSRRHSPLRAPIVSGMTAEKIHRFRVGLSPAHPKIRVGLLQFTSTSLHVEVDRPQVKSLDRDLVRARTWLFFVGADEAEKGIFAGMKVYLDDVRETPLGWVRTYTAPQTIALLKTSKVTQLSLDHDLGDGDGTGYDVLLWLENEIGTGVWHWPLPAIDIHSANPAGRLKMKAALRKIESMAG